MRDEDDLANGDLRAEFLGVGVLSILEAQVNGHLASSPGVTAVLFEAQRSALNLRAMPLAEAGFTTRLV